MAGKNLTLAQLAQYDGKDGRPGYVDSVIYDVSNSLAWQNGEHHGNLAGHDVSKSIHEDSPRGTKNLAKLPVVGKIIPE